MQQLELDTAFCTNLTRKVGWRWKGKVLSKRLSNSFSFVCVCIIRPTVSLSPFHALSRFFFHRRIWSCSTMAQSGTESELRLWVQRISDVVPFSYFWCMAGQHGSCAFSVLLRRGSHNSGTTMIISSNDNIFLIFINIYTLRNVRMTMTNDGRMVSVLSIFVVVDISGSLAEPEWHTPLIYLLILIYW